MEDNSAYRDLFFEETDQLLETLNEDILKLEQAPEDMELMNAIFRSAHTLKGMAATMGFDAMAKLTHWMENVFELFKKKELPVDHDAISLIFTCLDTLNDIVEDLRAGGEGEVDISGLVDRLERASQGGAPGGNAASNETAEEQSLVPTLETIESSDREVIYRAGEAGYKAYVIAVRVDNESMMKNVRAFMTLNNLAQQGEVIRSEPGAETLENEDFGQDFHLLYVSKLEEAKIKELIYDVVEIEEVAVAYASTVLKQMEEAKKQVASAETSEEAPAKQTKKQARAIKQTIRVDLNRLDQFMNLVSELVIHRTRLEDISSKFQIDEINEPLTQVARITSEMQEVVLQLRMQPFSVAVQRFPRMIRDLADELEKDIQLVIEGEDTELDRTVVSELSEPLVHLLRNSADHGIETPDEREVLGKPRQGTVKVAAYPEGNRVVVTISDDGKGLDPQAIQKSAEKKGIATDGLSDKELQELIFHPGFSTKEQVTGVSGRGVGMDAVKEKILGLNGTIETISEVGKGTTFRITLPLTLSIIQSLLVKAGRETFALPQAVIEKVEVYDEEKVASVPHSQVYLYKGAYIPVTHLSQALGLNPDKETIPHVILVKLRDTYHALVVDELVYQKEIVIKELGKELDGLDQYLGATILGNGEVVLILDLSTICGARRGTPA
ncbi:chemotaxis protein CheA [Atopococcus tabaci]|uniref:chemotaxis protein CheA n=1 Tax=Atopococcus tabaci TaxID=269774 RepID=UPI00041DD591|nr:chemotaxis protein CheA [Atopococcus tabaci]